MATYSEDLLRLAETVPNPIPHGMRRSSMLNPLCGDKCEIALDTEGNTVREVYWIAEGCAILRASTAHLAKTLKGKTLEDIKKIQRDFVASFGTGATHMEHPLSAVYAIPARYKCALLPWQALENFLRDLQR
ncbi:MAG: Zinc-dependent sulfurtransferase SufU [Turneriella sp.]|nr:Zinc-dependent sulfurtransferase SufU [Turneriella sp.]